MRSYIIQISEESLMEMSIASLEAYVIPQRKDNAKKKGLQTELETYGLLWGNEVILPDGDILLSIKKLTVDSMADRQPNCVWPSDGLSVIKDVITSYWPQYELLGDFHSHPYNHYTEVEELKGYDFSEGDRKFMLSNREKDDDYRVCLVMAISSLKRTSNAEPQHLDHNIVCWTFNNYRFWLNACLVDEENNQINLIPNSSHWEKNYQSNQVSNVFLHCPYLTGPWQATEFGKKIGRGNHMPGDI